MVDLVISVETVELSTTGTSVSFNLTKEQDHTNCVPFFSSRTENTSEFSQKTWDCYFSGTTESGIINFRRYTGGSTGYINCYVVEFDPDEVYVEQGTFETNAAQYDYVTTASGFNSSRTALAAYWRSDTPNQWYRTVCRCRVTGDGSLEFYRNNDGYSLNGHWFIFEARNDQFTVEHKTQSDDYGGTISLSRVYDPLKTFILMTWATNYTNPNGYYGSTRPFHYLRGDVRWDKGHDSGYLYTAFQVIEFQDDKIHVPAAHLTTIGSSSTTTFNWNREDRMQIPTTSGFSMVFKPAPYFDRTATSSTTLTDIDSTVELDNEYQITFRKGAYVASSYPSFQVIDWKGYTVASGVNDNPFDPEISFVKSVENIRILNEDWQGGKPLTKGQDINNCVVFSSQKNSYSSNNQYACMGEVYISNTRMVCTRRVSSSNELVTDVSVVEFYPDQVRVQSGTFYYYDLTTERTYTLPYSINTGRSFLLSKWAISSSNTEWRFQSVRSRILDSNTIGFYRNANSGYAEVTWFLAEDITEDNRCFDVTHWTTTNSNDYNQYRSSTKHYPPGSTFLIVSGATNYGGNYQGFGSFRAYYDTPHRPLLINRYGSGSNTSYYNAQLVRIRRSGRYYSHMSNPTFNTGDTTKTATYTSAFEGHEDITVYNTTMASFARNNGSTSTQAAAFITARVTDYDTRTIEFTRGTTAVDTYYSTFYIICWTGQELSFDASNYTVPTKSLVQSVEYFEYSGTGSRPFFWLAKGQNPDQCVPFMTWNANMPDNYLQRGLVSCYIESSFGPPHKVVPQRSAGSVNSSTTGVYLVEFDSRQVRVQRGSLGTTGTSTTVTIDEVDLERSFLLFYGYADWWTDDWRGHTISGKFDNSTTLSFRRYYDGGGMHVTWYVVECLQEQWFVQHAYSTQGSSTSNYYNSYSYRVPNQRKWEFNYYSANRDDHVPAYGTLRTWPRTDVLTQIQRYGTSGYANGVHYFSSEIVRFKKDTQIKTFWDDIGGNFSSYNHDIVPDGYHDYDVNMAIVFNPMMGGNTSRVDSYNALSLSQSWSHQKIVMDGDVPKVQVTRHNTEGTNSYSCSCFTVFPTPNKYFFEGIVKEERLVPTQRKVCLFRSVDHSLVDWTVSVSGTGYFYLETPYYEAHYAVCFDDTGGKDYNHLVHKDLYPTTIDGTFSYYEGLTVSGLTAATPTNPYSQYEVPEWQTW